MSVPLGIGGYKTMRFSSQGLPSWQWRCLLEKPFQPEPARVECQSLWRRYAVKDQKTCLYASCGLFAVGSRNQLSWTVFGVWASRDSWSIEMVSKLELWDHDRLECLWKILDALGSDGTLLSCSTLMLFGFLLWFACNWRAIHFWHFFTKLDSFWCFEFT